jgi:polysaccharide deacetylase family protein (PEP-CTERM system associated)
MNATNHILLTFDVEDWFQVENFKPYIPFSTWQNRELRVEKNTHKLLDLLDQQSNQPTNDNAPSTTDTGPEITTSFPRSGIGSDHFHPRLPAPEGAADGGQVESDPDNNKSQKSSKSCLTTPKATFFVLGWIAERLPHLVKEIHSRGHEVASHGYHHTLCTDFASAQLRRDLSHSKKCLEDTLGAPVYGYRAPSFSINDDILKIIEQCGYQYDSSFNSFGIHSRYGKAHLSKTAENGVAIPVNQKSAIENRQFFELPISNIPLFPFPTLGNSGILAHFRHFCLPWGGGAYFRLMPFPLFLRGVQAILKKQNAYLFYMHPWELDPTQPRVNEASLFFKFRHYTNLSKTASKLSSFIEAFKHCTFITCYHYLQEAHSP